MPSIPLPENASLEHLKKQAKRLQQLVHSRDNDAGDLTREFHPRFADHVSGSKVGEFKRADAQLVVARLYGFASWPKLRSAVKRVREYTRPDPGDVHHTDEVDRFVALACVSYTGRHADGGRVMSARAFLDANPDLGTASVAALAVTGHHDLLHEHIERDGSIVNRAWGPNDWPPLLYCCYSRLDVEGLSTLATARLLLEAGADANAGFLWHGLVPPFTALTGAFGRGESDQPPHSEAVALARLLLEAGADPNDGQTLYNNGLAGTAHDDTTHLELLVEFGLGTGGDGPWYERFGGQLTSPEELLNDELEVAAHRGLVNRMRFLVALGLDLDRPVGRSKKTPAQLARQVGHTAVLEVLSGAGGPS